MRRQINTFQVHYLDLNGLEKVEEVEAYSEFWAKAIFLTEHPFCTIVKIL